MTGGTTDREPGAPGRWDHPSPEELSAYQANELTPERDDAIQEHLAGCSLCTGALLDLHRFLDPPEEDRPREGVADFETAAEWRVLREKIEEEKRQVPLGPVAETSPSRRFSGASRTAYALAAVFAMATLGVFLYVQSLRQDRQSSILNSPQVFLPSTLTVREGDSLVKTVQLPQRGRKLVTVILELARRNVYPEYRVEVRDHQGRRIFVESGLNKHSDGQAEVIRFKLSSDLFQPGRYLVTLEGLKSGKTDRIEQHEIEIVRK